LLLALQTVISLRQQKAAPKNEGVMFYLVRNGFIRRAFAYSIVRWPVYLVLQAFALYIIVVACVLLGLHFDLFDIDAMDSGQQSFSVTPEALEATNPYRQLPEIPGLLQTLKEGQLIPTPVPLLQHKNARGKQQDLIIR
jgi:hypothetical protein